MNTLKKIIRMLVNHACKLIIKKEKKRKRRDFSSPLFHFCPVLKSLIPRNKINWKNSWRRNGKKKMRNGRYESAEVVKLAKVRN
jgi:hypothetical protein